MVRRSSLRAFLGAIVAVIFAIAVVPGVMAMPSAAPHGSMHEMGCPPDSAPPCDHAKAEKGTCAPSKSTHLCLGMLACFGMTAVIADQAAPQGIVAVVRTPDAAKTLSGLSPPPDDRPPIA